MSTLDELSALADQLALPALSGVSDDELMQLQRRLAGIRRPVDAAAAEVAAEIGRRSTRELGYAGLAQRVGARSPEKLVQALTGTSIREARTLVEAGRMLTAPPDSERDGSVLAGAIRAGAISLEQARAIEIGLGPVSTAVPDALLNPPRRELVEMAARVPLEELRAHARVLRDELDSASVADREAELRERRYLRLFPQEDGMTRLAGLLDPESAARVQTVVHAALSPRLGGPRFVDDEDRERAERINNDPRTNDQLALDAVVALIDVGVGSDSARPILGRHGAPVHVLVTERDLRTGSGFARIVGQESAVSIATAERRICSDGGLPILFDADRRAPLKLGRTRRRFSAGQRAALAARDGCCRRCGRPVAQTEAHHITPWSHGGPTDIDNAILLCRFDHLLVHNNGWRIERDAHGGFWFVPPPDVDPVQRPIAAHPPDPIVRRIAG